MIPKYAKTAKPVTIDDLRKFVAPFGQDIAVLMTWNNKDNITNLVTAGSDQLYAQCAAQAREKFEKVLGFEPADKLTADLRHEHLKGPPQTEQKEAQVPHIVVSLTHEDLGFLLWNLGRLSAEKRELDKEHQDYIGQYHSRLLPIFGRAYEQIGKLPRHAPSKNIPRKKQD